MNHVEKPMMGGRLIDLNDVEPEASWPIDVVHEASANERGTK